jgi:anti-anti-sigma regulatory factor
MTFKLERHFDGHCTTFRLIGHMKAEHLAELKTLIEESRAKVTMDLEEVDLVDIDGVRFLNACESAGVAVLHCSSYIRKWMLQEQGRPKDHPER